MSWHPYAIALALSAPLLAGCLVEPDDRALPSAVDAAPVVVLPGERPVASAATWHEEVKRTTPAEVDDGFVIENNWEPRDVDLTYHGVQPVYDEWGRTVPAHIFRYQPMTLVITDVEFLNDFADVRITARYEPTSVEHAFAQSDARYLGEVELEHQVRVFEDYRWPNPFSWGYEGSLLLPMAYLFLGGDLDKPVVGPFGNTTFNQTTVRPLAGDCTPYEFEFTPAPWFQAWIDSEGGDEPADDAAPEEEQHEIVCLQDEAAPLWVYSGNASDHLRIERKSPALATPRLAGTPLDPVTMSTYSFEELPMLLGLANPVDVPPSAYPGDWADLVRPVVQGAGTNLDYVQWQLQRDPIHLTDIYKAFPYFGAGLVPSLLGVSDIGFEKTSWVMLGDGTDMFWAFVDSRYAGPEDPDIHISQQGFAFDDHPTHPQPLVASGEVQAIWETQLPVDPGLLLYSSFPDLSGDLPPEYVDYVTPFLTSWTGLEYCFEDKDGGRYGSFSAFNGQMNSMGAQTSTENGCSSGAVSVSSSSGEATSERWTRLALGPSEAWLRSANGAPSVLVVPDAQQALVLDANTAPADLVGLVQAALTAKHS